jgi:putative pyrroloquinoline-quinone binding quinoprotein
MRRATVVFALFGAVLIAVPMPTARSAPGAQRNWVRIYGTPEPERAVAVTSTVGSSQLAIAMTRHPEGGGSPPDISTVGIDAATGKRVWRSRYGTEANREVATAIATSSDGATIYVAGIQRSPDRAPRWLVIAYEARSGRKLWGDRFSVPKSTFREPVMVVVGEARVFLLGTRFVHATPTQLHATGIVVAAAARTGRHLWTRYLHPGGADATWHVVTDAAYDPARDELDVAMQVDETPTRDSLRC